MDYDMNFKVKFKSTYFTPEGVKVPVEYMTEQNVLKQQIADDLGERALELQAQIAAFRKYAEAMLEWYRNRVANMDGVKPPKGRCGYIRVTGFDGRFKAELNNYPYVIYGEGLLQAKMLMDEVISERLEGVDQFLIDLYNSAFTINQEGEVNVNRVLKLTQFEVDDDRWKRAIKLINKDRQNLIRKKFVRIRQRNADTGALETIHLNIANV